MKKLARLLLCSVLVSGLAGCNKDNTDTPEHNVPVINAMSPTSMAAAAHRDKIVYKIDNPIDGESITAVTTAEWIGSFDYAVAGEVSFEVAANDGDARTATITLSYAKAQSVDVDVRQMAASESISLSHDQLAFAAAGGDIAVTVSSGNAWTLEGESDWLTASKREGADGDEVVFTAIGNEGDDPREASFTFKCGDEIAMLTATQSFEERIVVEKAVYELDNTAQTLVITLQSNAETSCTMPEGVDWIKPADGTAALKTESFAFEVAANDGAAREAVITFACGKVLEQVTVKQGDDDLLMKIADEKLREFVKTNFDANGDGILTEAEAAAVTELVFTEGAASAEGIEIFPNLTKIDLRNSTFTTVDLSKNTKLQEVGFNYCQALESIDLTGLSEIVSLNFGLCSALKSIDITGLAKLVDLIGYSSGITSLDTSNNPELDFLSVYGTGITSLDLSANTKLTYLNAGCETLESLDLSVCKALTELSLSNSSKLTSIDLSANTALTKVSLDGCDLRTVDISALSELTEITVSSNNNFERIDISNNLKLKTLYSICYPGGGEGAYDLYLLREQDDVEGAQYRVSLWTGTSCNKIYVEPDVSDSIADTTFKQYCLDNFDTDNDGRLTQAEIDAVTEINTSLTFGDGIELFTNLVSLKANYSTCSTLDLSKNTKLEIFYMSYNTNLESVDLTGCTALKEIMVSGCTKLTSLDTSNLPALEEVYAQTSGLTSFDAPNSAKLWYLSVYDTKIESLDISKNVGITNLLAGRTAISTLDLSANTALETLDLTEAYNITSLDLSHNTALTLLTLDGCNFETVDTDALTELVEFNINSANYIKKLDISKNLKLAKLSALCYPGDGEGAYTLYMLRSQENSVSLWTTFCCEKVYVD